ncbi:uncharacterized protein LOC115354601 [Myripristis murdjan]|uniref:uncharacterized protein LOC115354601 n=1 Tax=Myripristis murdjan TaxID=586833 RepID=UPI001175E146|nr:uncharacterized protein LOC115354601 [Myripristis murdjan]
MCCDQPEKTNYSVSIWLTVVERLSALQVVAIPGYPVVVEGQGVTMHCIASTWPALVVWSWERLDKQGKWQKVGTSRDLILTKAEESGRYRCHAKSLEHRILQNELSPNHTVYIISLPLTVGEKLGIAGFCLLLVALIILFLILFWLVRQRANETAALQALSTANTLAKGFAGPGKAPNGNQTSDCEGEMYMNYQPTDQAYTDLDPAYMTGDEVYSSLS